MSRHIFFWIIKNTKKNIEYVFLNEVEEFRTYIMRHLGYESSGQLKCRQKFLCIFHLIKPQVFIFFILVNCSRLSYVIGSEHNAFPTPCRLCDLDNIRTSRTLSTVNVIKYTYEF